MSGLSNVKLHLIDSMDDVLKFHEWLGSRRPFHALAIDTETTGLKIGRDVVRLAQIGDGEHGWAMPFSNEVGKQGRFIGSWAGLLHDVVERWDGEWWLHNAKFDVGMLDHMGVKLPRQRIKDTRIAAHIHQPHMSTALKNVSNRLIDGASSLMQQALQVGTWTWDTVPIDYVPYWTYGALDPVLTYRVGELLIPQVEADAPVAWELENAVQWVIERMERYGAHINHLRATTKLNEFMKYVQDTEDWILKEYGVKAGSNAAIVKILQDAGFEFGKSTASGAVALDKEVLGGIDHPLAKAVLSRRQIQKLASTYLRHFVDDVDGDDLIHPSINTLGARTSRMSMSDPNLQNLPRKNTDNPAADVIRECIEAREGNVMMMCDFDQVEMRGLAHMAQETSMIEAFKGDTDFFVALARMVYDDSTIVKKSPRRQIVKNAGYATIYGAGIEKFALTAGISYAQASQVRARWDQLFPGVVKFQRAVIDIAVQRRSSEGMPYVRCPITGRKQVGDPGKEYALVNFLIQGASAAIFKMKLLELEAAGLGDFMVAPVHDEIVLDIPKDRAEDAAQILRDVMNDDTILSVPLTASVSYGQTWGSKEEWVDVLDDKRINPTGSYSSRGRTHGKTSREQYEQDVKKGKWEPTTSQS